MIEAAITGDEHRHLAAGRAGGYRVVATIILAHALVGGVAVIFGYGGIAVHAERAFQHATQRAVAVAPVHRLHQHRYRGRLARSAERRGGKEWGNTCRSRG